MQTTKKIEEKQRTTTLRQEALEDFRWACLSREASLLGRKEVLTGKAKFGIFGDGKEIAQVAMARAFRKGDFRSGYYRDQTFMFASGLASLEQFFAQLYAHASLEHEPFSAGRQMNAHFATPLVDNAGNWLVQKELKNVSADISPTAGQMARALGIALASKKYRESKELAETTVFSHKGEEVSFCTIGDASTSEGVFWETLNAAAVQQVPLAVMVWDDGYGISVPIEYQTTKASISEALAGFEAKAEGEKGIAIHKVKAWDYEALRNCFEQGVDTVRYKQQPALFHVHEVTQPQGHSTSGSHERYKSKERLAWETEWDGIRQMGLWLIAKGWLTEEEETAIRKEAKKEARQAAKNAWAAFRTPIDASIKEVDALLQALVDEGESELLPLLQELQKAIDPIHKDALRIVRRALQSLRRKGSLGAHGQNLRNWLEQEQLYREELYCKHLYSETAKAARNIEPIAPEYDADAPLLNGFELLNRNFDHILSTRPEVFAFGEDVGNIGDVNQGFMGMQAKYGEERVFDTGIREWTIIGQALGMAMRGLRPIAEIQYLDYLIYALSPLSDDLATLRYRSAGQQQAPAIIRTRGHRLEGIWHSGSPISMILGSLRGVCVLVPRDMTRAAGFYNTMLQSDDPALIIECLNGYRLKERLPSNLHEMRIPVGKVEVLQEGTDISLVSYGSSLRIAQEAIDEAAKLGISVELIDVQSLLPFDLDKDIAKSLQKTNRLLVLDEDVPGGASAYILQQILVEQKGYYCLDSEPKVLSAKAVRPAYGSDGDYIIKPNAEDVFDALYAIMHEAKPEQYPWV